MSCCVISSLNRFLAPAFTPFVSLRPTFREPDVQIDDAILDLWKRDQLENAEASLTASISQSQNSSHHVLASRALVRMRLQGWDAALLDAEMVSFTLFTRTLTLTLVYTKALKMEPSLTAYIAKSLAHVGNSERDKGYRTCDIAFERFHSSHVTFLLLIKVCIFVPGFLTLLTSLRPLSCLWRESASMRSHGWTIL